MGVKEKSRLSLAGIQGTATRVHFLDLSTTTVRSGIKNGSNPEVYRMDVKVYLHFPSLP